MNLKKKRSVIIMLYLLCIILPPVAVLLTGKPIQALLNLLLCFGFWLPGVIHAFAVVNDHKSEKRLKKHVSKAM